MSFFYDDLSEHPDTMTLEIAGKEIEWLLNKPAFNQASEEGIELSEFNDLEEDDVAGNLDALAALLYIGTIPFQGEEEFPTVDDFDRVLTPRVASEVGPKIVAKFEGLTEEEIEAVMGEE